MTIGKWGLSMKTFGVKTLAPMMVLAVTACTYNPPFEGGSIGAQGWSAGEQAAWYTATQGSRLVPLAWLDALEQPESTDPFLKPEYFGKFGYLPKPANYESKSSCPIGAHLPIGFSVDCQSDKNLNPTQTKLRWKKDQKDKEPWVGLNCAACHTTKVEYNGQARIIDGGPTLADFQSFTHALEKAQESTLNDPAKLDRFVDRLRADKALLEDALRTRVAWNKRLTALNMDAPLHSDPKPDDVSINYGYGRLDAIGHIFNKVAAVAMPTGDQTRNPADAPVSYPFLWNVPQLDKVEWNGLATNNPIKVIGVFDVGAIGRNAGEVIGVFADITIKPEAGVFNGYRSSINVPNLVGMEEQLRKLKPPKWPDDLFTNNKIDHAMAARGKVKFDANCRGCHQRPTQDYDIDDKYITMMSPVSTRLDPFDASDRKGGVGTDIWMACNAAFAKAQSGILNNSKGSIVSGNRIGLVDDNLVLVRAVVVGSLLDNKLSVIGSALRGLFGVNNTLPEPKASGLEEGIDKSLPLPPELPTKSERRRQCIEEVADGSEKARLVAYKARPLQGIWATAPYLHNGSVRTLWDLLLPAEERPKNFYIGSYEFDPKYVGYVDKSPEQKDGNWFHFVARYPQAVPDSESGDFVDGNSNAGHDYGNKDLTPDERWELIEYMKTL